QLRVGDIIATEHDVHAPLEVTVSGVPKFHARAGVYKGRKAIELLGVIEKEPRSK
ncbi:MAG TPA: FliM/FliN family flagellar motor switch protein, partial [Planctomycetaceae bacterium]|nr:FliM/FliN family flagellar motor switch protein [Planctomycetaceae bacterium]